MNLAHWRVYICIFAKRSLGPFRSFQISQSIFFVERGNNKTLVCNYCTFFHFVGIHSHIHVLISAIWFVSGTVVDNLQFWKSVLSRHAERRCFNWIFSLVYGGKRTTNLLLFYIKRFWLALLKSFLVLFWLLSENDLRNSFELNQMSLYWLRRCNGPNVELSILVLQFKICRVL